MSGQPIKKAPEYTNPVYPHSFPDPFVLKHKGNYFAYCTGLAPHGDVFTVLSSDDLVNWTELGAAMKRLGNDSPFYWAPEVVHSSGRFYLYYSVGNETLMELRVAVSDRPDGGFIDAGKRLTTEEFAIDAHVFVDEDGTRYMFYATDFLEHTHIGTGIVVDKMIDWHTLAGEPRPVTRVKYDWQVYDPQREEKGGVRWHTVEGPAVLKRKGVYFEMFSGGNWQNISYGVGFAVTDDIDDPDEWIQFSDGRTVLPVLRTISGKILGPGHNSVVRGPNNRELYCVYHRWTQHGRVMAIDRMDIVHRRLFVLGATDTPQPAPLMPTVDGFQKGWSRTGRWDVSQRTARGSRGAKLSLNVPESFFCEFTLQNDADMNVRLRHEDGELIFDVSDAREAAAGGFGVPGGAHEISAEVDGKWVRVHLDRSRTVAADWHRSPCTCLSLQASAENVELSGFALTEGFEDRFDRGPNGIEFIRTAESGHGTVSDGDGEIKVEASPKGLFLKRSQVFTELDMAANIRAGYSEDDRFVFGLGVQNAADENVLQLTVGKNLRLKVVDNITHSFDLPDGWNIYAYHQYRILASGGEARIYLESELICTVPLAILGLSPSIFCKSGTISVEMVRATGIRSG